MSRVLYLSSKYIPDAKGNIHVDLVDTFLQHGHEVTVITPVERKYHQATSVEHKGAFTLIRARSLNFLGAVSLLEKGVATMLFGYWYRFIIKKYLRGQDAFDLVICATLPITYAPVMDYFHQKHDSFVYLLHKDFFPQNAVDLGILKKKSLIYKTFRHIEQGLYRRSDSIGVISPKNVEFILENNTFLSEKQVEVCPNGTEPTPWEDIAAMKSQRDEIRAKYGIPTDRAVFVNGGTISRAPNIEFILEVVRRAKECPQAYFLFVGRGQAFARLQQAAESTATDNVKILSYLPKVDYDTLLAACDAGMVFLDGRFTVANIPSKTLSHMNMAQPIVSATDTYTDYRELLEKNALGLWSSADDVETFLANINKLAASPELCQTYGENARRYLEKEFTAEITYQTIIQHIAS